MNNVSVEIRIRTTFSYLGENVSFWNFYATYFEIKICVLRMKIQIFNHIFTNCVISQK